jgi:hypothetical protein
MALAVKGLKNWKISLAVGRIAETDVKNQVSQIWQKANASL